MSARTVVLTLALAGLVPAQSLAASQLPAPPVAALPAPPPTAAALSYAPGKVPSTEEILRLPDSLRELVRERVVRRGGTEEQRLERLFALLFGEDAAVELEYDIEATRSVAEAWRDHRANCLSFTLLVVAMAREAGLVARVRELGDSVAWYQDAGAVYNVDHVNAGIRAGNKVHVVDLDRRVLVSRHSPRVIDDDRAIAHFHNNRGAELLAAGDLVQAQLALEAALALAPDFVPAWSNLGVLLQRRGDHAGAGQALLRAHALQPEHAPTLRNLANYYLRVEQPRLAQFYTRRLEQSRRSDPFHHFARALSCEHERDLECAIRYYRQAIRLQPGEHQFHFGLARVHAMAGDAQAVRRELARAASATSSDSLRSLYHRKLQALQARGNANPGPALAR